MTSFKYKKAYLLVNKVGVNNFSNKMDILM